MKDLLWSVHVVVKTLNSLSVPLKNKVEFSNQPPNFDNDDQNERIDGRFVLMTNSEVDNLIERQKNANSKNKRLVQEIVVLHGCLYNKQNITCSLWIRTLIFSCSSQYLTRLLRSLVRWDRLQHSKIKFVFTHGHVISSISSSRPAFFILIHFFTVIC